MNFLQLLLRTLAILWASPYTLLGLAVGLVGVCFGGHVRITWPVIQFYEGGTKWMIQRFLPNGQFVLAMTLGHVVIGQTAASLDISHEHELVHVRQFERWGPLMGPAYIGCSIYMWLIGRRAYRDNPFEVEAYGEE